MTRKSTQTDKKLLDEGRKLLIKKGASQLTLREVAEAAEVNLGMFNYHFGNKDRFIESILEAIYEEFLADFELKNQESDLETLEEQLFLMASFARDNRHLILVLLNDILNGEKVVQRFARNQMRKHFVILGKTLRGCQKKGLVEDVPLPLIITQIAGSIGLSNLIPEALKYVGVNKVFETGLRAFTKDLVSDKALRVRVRLLLNGIKRQTSE